MSIMVWKGKVKEDGDTHLVSMFEEKVSGLAERALFEASLCGRRPRDKGPLLPASGCSVTCKGCKKQYKSRTGRDWKEPPP